MRLTKTATVAFAAALSGSLALGVVGTAAARTPTHRVAVRAVPAHTGCPVTTTAAAAAEHAETSRGQFLVIQRLGQLAELTGKLGGLTYDVHATPLQLRVVQHQLHTRLQQVRAAVELARPVRTLPTTEPKNEPALALFDAARAFRASVDGIVAVDRTDTKARTAASGALVRDLSVVQVAAMKEAGMPIQETLPHTLPQPTAVHTDRTR